MNTNFSFSDIFFTTLNYTSITVLAVKGIPVENCIININRRAFLKAF